MEKRWRYEFIEFLIDRFKLRAHFAAPRALPRNLWLMRHGHSVGNYAIEQAIAGNTTLLDHWRKIGRHSRTWELTERGRWQVSQAGIWLHNNGHSKFDHGYVSEYDRARESASLAGIAGNLEVEWHPARITLRERDRGIMDSISPQDLEMEYKDVKLGQDQDPYLNRFRDGESLAEAEMRWRIFSNETLERESPNQDAIVCIHDELMMVALRYHLALSSDQLTEVLKSDDDHKKIHNAQFIHFTREVEGSKYLTPYYNRFRSICPWDMNKSTNVWQPINIRNFTHEQLLNSIRKHDFPDPPELEDLVKEQATS